jgi:hypothetical protein
MKLNLKRTWIVSAVIFILAAQVGAQEPPNTVVVHGMDVGMVAGGAATVTGAPYSATVKNESVQTLADGTRIVHSSSGTIARDAQGRTRQDAPLPTIGNLSAENAPHIVFIMDPVAQVSYTLNLTDKTAQKMPMAGSGHVTVGPVTRIDPSKTGDPTDMISSGGITMSTSGPAGAGSGNAVYIQSEDVTSMGAPGPTSAGMFIQKTLINPAPSEMKTEDLGTQTIEGLLVSGTRMTHNIATGQIGNDRPISMITEVWTSPDLKTIVSSKRSDPRMGEQTFQLMDITRAEPDASLFTIPSDFKVVEGQQKITYGVNR